MKIIKGELGYIKSFKQKRIIMSIFWIFMILLFVISGYISTGSRMNLFTVIAAVSAIPLAMEITRFIPIYKYKGLDEKEFEKHKSPAVLWDVILTTKEVVFFVPVMVIDKDRLILYFIGNNKKSKKLYDYLNVFLNDKKINIVIKNDINSVLKEITKESMIGNEEVKDKLLSISI